MGLFNYPSSYSRPGPGIDKNAPPKKGVALFLDILGREFWALLLVNVIYVLFCLPIITIGPATAALYRVTVTMVRDKNVYAWKDFWEAFKSNWKQGLIFGIPFVLFLLAAVWMNLMGLIQGVGSLLVVAAVWTMIGLSVFCYVFALISNVALPAWPLLKDAVFLMVLGKIRTLAAALVIYAVNMAMLLYWPLSFPVALLLGSAFPTLFSSFMVWPVIQKYVIQEAQAQPEQPQESDT